MTTTTARFSTTTDGVIAIPAGAHNIDHTHDANRSAILILMNEVLSRVRMRERSERVWPAGHRPARLVAMEAAKRRERL